LKDVSEIFFLIGKEFEWIVMCMRCTAHYEEWGSGLIGALSVERGVGWSEQILVTEELLFLLGGRGADSPPQRS
jgi:hypothetical protein